MDEPTCEQGGCGKSHYARGMCKPHYRADYYRRNKERENANSRAYREANLEQRKARWASYAEARWGDERRARKAALAARLAAPKKACTGCGEEKLKTDFHRDPRRKDGRYSWCKSCFHAHVASTRTVESEAERRRAAYADEETREKLLAKHRAWAKANPEKNRQYASRRRARILQSAVGEVDYGAILKRDGMVCHLCGTGIEALADLHFDHVIPVSRGGAHSMDNIKSAHAVCNLRKHDKLIAELDWLITG